MSNSRSVPPQIDAALAACITIAQARCADLRRAEQAYSALEKFLYMVRGGEPMPPAPDEDEQAALLSLVRQETARRLTAVHEALECLSAASEEELARRQEEA